jgi:hypothetical protein
VVSTDLGPVGRGHHGECGQSAIHPYEAGRIFRWARPVAALWVKVRSMDIEADIPTGPIAADRSEHDPGTRPHPRYSGLRIEMLHWTEEPPNPAGVLMHADRADPREDHTAGMAITNADRQRAALASLVPKPEAVTTSALALGLRKPYSAAPAHAGPGVAVGSKCPTEVDRSFLEHLRRYRMPPCQARDLFGDGAV